MTGGDDDGGSDGCGGIDSDGEGVTSNGGGVGTVVMEGVMT